MVKQNTNSASVLYTVQLNRVELGLFGGEVTSLGGETSWWRDDQFCNYKNYLFLNKYLSPESLIYLQV